MDITTIVMALLVFALLGFLCYLIVTYIPMPEPFKQVIIVVLVILIILYLLGMVTGHASLPHLSTR